MGMGVGGEEELITLPFNSKNRQPRFVKILHQEKERVGERREKKNLHFAVGISPPVTCNTVIQLFTRAFVFGFPAVSVAMNLSFYSVFKKKVKIITTNEITFNIR
eukprot:TRINITY_DN3071_c0_g2_i1.p2 TRINITY_DN3071_c0_g2~~TRINITY_DN3071_c0_g2_i1.p2  ORF type:complete len:105 (-),score=11.23 TRINITY_DN3071_c0_g2_i1:514-828(-)